MGKFGKKGLAVLVGISILAGIAVPVATSKGAKASAQENPVVGQEEGEASGLTLMADVIVIKYRAIGGKLQYRRWNETKGVWVDADWIDLTEEVVPVAGAPTGVPVSGNMPTPSPTGTPTKALSPTGTPMLSPTKAPTNVPTGMPTKAPTPSPTKAPTRKPTEVPTPTKAPTNVPTGAPTLQPTKAPVVYDIPALPEQKVAKADLFVDLVPIDGEHFSSENFRNYLWMKCDTDGDGFLSKEEREALTAVAWDGWVLPAAGMENAEPVTVFDGLDWFPNLESVSWTGNCILYAKDHPSLAFIGAGDADGEVWAEHCEKLENMGFCMYRGSIHINDCKNLKYINGYENNFLEFYAVGTPSLILSGNSPIGYPQVMYLDADATLALNPHGSSGIRGEWVSLERNGVPSFGLGGGMGVKWLGLGQFPKGLKEDFERMQAMHGETVLQAKAEKITVKSTDTQNKRMYLYFSNVGTEPGYAARNNVASFLTGASGREYVLENFSLEGRPGQQGTFFAVWYNPKQASIFACLTSMDVYYTENGQKKRLEGDHVNAVHYFVREPDGGLTMYDACADAFAAIGRSDAYEDLQSDVALSFALFGGYPRN